MSSWRVGAEAVTAKRGPVTFGPEQEVDKGGTVTAAIDRLTKWIPGDVLAFYVAAVTAFGAKSGAKPSPVLLVVFIILAGLVVLGGAFAASGELPRSVLLPAVLAAVAFTIWTLSVPFSGWQQWGFVNDNQAAVALVAAILGLLFGFVADGLAMRAARR